MIESADTFCANPKCALHVSSNDPNAVGEGDWAQLPNGFMFGRALIDEHYYCHACADDSHNPPTLRAG